jgi:hypothetical protein
MQAIVPFLFTVPAITLIDGIQPSLNLGPLFQVHSYMRAATLVKYFCIGASFGTLVSARHLSFIVHETSEELCEEMRRLAKLSKEQQLPTPTQ